MNNNVSETASNKLIRIKDVVEITGISKSYIYHLVNQGQFPKNVQLVPGGTSVAWVESEVRDWIATRIKERDMGCGVDVKTVV